MPAALPSLPRPLAALALLVGAVAVACSTPSPPKSRFEREFQRYLSLPHQKVMAIAGDPDGQWVYGLGYGFRSMDRARDAALEQCNVRRESLESDAPCVVYATGNEVASDQDPEAE